MCLDHRARRAKTTRRWFHPRRARGAAHRPRLLRLRLLLVRPPRHPFCLLRRPRWLPLQRVRRRRPESLFDRSWRLRFPRNPRPVRRRPGQLQIPAVPHRCRIRFTRQLLPRRRRSFARRARCRPVRRPPSRRRLQYKVRRMENPTIRSTRNIRITPFIRHTRITRRTRSPELRIGAGAPTLSGQDLDFVFVTVGPWSDAAPQIEQQAACR